MLNIFFSFIILLNVWPLPGYACKFTVNWTDFLKITNDGLLFFASGSKFLDGKNTDLGYGIKKLAGQLKTSPFGTYTVHCGKFPFGKNPQISKAVLVKEF